MISSYFIRCLFLRVGDYSIVKYRAWGDAMYNPQMDACGYIAPFSVSLMPIWSISSNSANGNIIFWSGRDGYPTAGRMPSNLAANNSCYDSASSGAYPHIERRTR